MTRHRKQGDEAYHSTEKTYCKWQEAFDHSSINYLLKSSSDMKAGPGYTKIQELKLPFFGPISRENASQSRKGVVS
jgi:hypothetical protein